MEDVVEWGESAETIPEGAEPSVEKETANPVRRLGCARLLQGLRCLSPGEVGNHVKNGGANERVDIENPSMAEGLFVQPVDELPTMVLNDPRLLPQRLVGKGVDERASNSSVLLPHRREERVCSVQWGCLTSRVFQQMRACAVDVLPSRWRDERELIRSNADHRAIAVMEIIHGVPDVALDNMVRPRNARNRPELWAGESGQRMEKGQINRPNHESLDEIHVRDGTLQEGLDI